MTVSSPENKVESTLKQEQVDISVSQPKADVAVSQQTPQESKGEDATTTQEDPNWKAFREARKRDRAEREAAERRAVEKEAEVTALKAAMEAAFSKSAPSTSAYNQYYGLQQPGEAHEETEDDRIEKKVQAALAAREAQAEKARQEREMREYPQRLEQAYPDFKHTINQDTLDYLDYHYPEVSRPLQRLPEGFDKWSDIYKAVKKFVPNQASAKQDAHRAEVNTNKPRSISSPNITQPGEAVGNARLTEERRAANWERMQKVLKGVS